MLNKVKSVKTKLILAIEVCILLLLIVAFLILPGLKDSFLKETTFGTPLPQIKSTPTPFQIDFDKLAESGFAKVSDSEYAFENKEKNFEVLISQKTPNEDLNIKVGKNGKFITLGFVGPSNFTQSEKKSLRLPIFDLFPKKVFASSFLKDEKAILETNSSDSKELTVKNLLPNVELKYNISNTKLKEEIVLKDKEAPSKYTFDLELEGLTFKRQADGLWYFYAKDDQNFKNPLFYIPKPFMVDAKGERSETVEIDISAVGKNTSETSQAKSLLRGGPMDSSDGGTSERNSSNPEGIGEVSLGSKHTLILTADPDWLTDPTRAYPVTIDPTIELVILTVHSHPQTGDNWEVSFETKGQADLTISPVDQATINDLDFVSLKCDGEEKSLLRGGPAKLGERSGDSSDGGTDKGQIKEGDVLFYPNWSCEGTGEIIHHVNVAGKHTLKFQFGEETGYAYNNPGTALLVCDFDGTYTCKFGETPSYQTGTEFTTGYRNQGVFIDSGTSYERLAYDSSGNFDDNQGTMALLTKFDWAGNAPTENRYILHHPYTSPWYGTPYIVYAYDGDWLRCETYLGGSSFITAQYNISSWPANEWHHIACTYDADGSPSIKLYVDGDLKQSATGTWTPTVYVNTYVGSTPWTSEEKIHGVVDEVRIFNSILSQTEIQQVKDTGAWIDKGEICQSNNECVTNNCSCDYNNHDCYCAPAGNCAHRDLVYSNDFSTDPGITSLGNHAYKLVDFPSTTNYEIRYKWNLDKYNAPGPWGYSWGVTMCTTSTCRRADDYHDAMTLHTPDTDTGYSYGLTGKGDTVGSYWGTPVVDTVYTIRLSKNGSSGTFNLYQESTLLTTKSFNTENWASVNRTGITAPDQTWMTETVQWRSAQKDVYVYTYRTDTGYSDTSYIDDLVIYSDPSCGSGCYGYTNGSTSEGHTCSSGDWTGETRFEGVKMEGVKIE